MEANGVGVLGAGSWGGTLALHLSRSGIDVTLWEFDERRAETLAATRDLGPFLPGVRIPAGIRVTSDLAAALRCNTVVVVVPSHTLRSLGEGVRAVGLIPPRGFVVATKGIEEDTGLTPSQVWAESTGTPQEALTVLVGPSLAAEVAKGLPTAVVAASVEGARSEAVQRLFAGPTFRVYTSTDVLGVELGVSLKNVIAIAAGICAGLELGSNALGALLTRGLAEIMRLGVAMGAKAETFLGLAGVGDLVTTCTSRLSRNYRVGFALAKGERLEQILAGMVTVAEGVRTTRAALKLGRRFGVDLPIADAVAKIMFEGRAPREVLSELMRRPLRPEFGR